MTLENTASQQVAPSEVLVQQQNLPDTTPHVAADAAYPTPPDQQPPASTAPVSAPAEPAAPAQSSILRKPLSEVISDEPAEPASTAMQTTAAAPAETLPAAGPSEDCEAVTESAPAVPSENAEPVEAIEPAEGATPCAAPESSMPPASAEPPAPAETAAPTLPVEETVEAEVAGEPDAPPSVEYPVEAETVEQPVSASVAEATEAVPAATHAPAQVVETSEPAAPAEVPAPVETVEAAEAAAVPEAAEHAAPDAAPVETAAEQTAEPAAPGDATQKDARSAPAKQAADSAPLYDDETVRSLMDILIMSDGVIQPQERAFAIDLLQQVITRSSFESKRVLCERLANMDDAPERLISLFLQTGEIRIAAPLLHRANCVSDSELMVVVEGGDRERCKLIAARPQLSGVVASALAKSSERLVLLELASNKSVHLAQEAIDQLTVRACSEPDLIEPLIMRPEMTTAHALYLFWSMGSKHRAYTLGRFLTDIRVLPQALVMSGSSDGLAAAAHGGRQGDAGQNNAAVAARPDREKASELLAAMDLGETECVATLISEYAGLAPETATRISQDEGGEAHVVVCKALGASRFAFADICQRQVEAGAPPESVEALQILFDTLSFNQARMALTYWDWFSNRLGPYANFPGRDVTSAQDAS